MEHQSSAGGARAIAAPGLSKDQKAILAAEMEIIGATRKDAALCYGISETFVEYGVIVLKQGNAEEKEQVLGGTRPLHKVVKAIRGRGYYVKNRSVICKRKRERHKPTIQPPPKSLVGGGRLFPPEHTTVEQWVRRGLAKEADGMAPNTAAKAINMGIQSYRAARDMVLLVDADLPDRDAKIARAALTELNETRRLAATFAKVRQISERLRGKTRLGKASRLADRFQTAVVIIAQACATASEFSVPHMPKDQATDSIAALEVSRVQLETIIANLKEIYDD